MSDLAARIVTWMSSCDAGISSKAICAHMATGILSDRFSYPRDPADLGRCLRLLNLFPEWLPRMGEMAQYGAGWAGLARRWEEVSVSMADEVGIDWSKGRSAPRTYELMQAAIAAGYRDDPDIECTFAPDGSLRSWRQKPGGSRSVML